MWTYRTPTGILNILFNGKYVRIDDRHRVYVRIHKGGLLSKEQKYWQEVLPSDVCLNDYNPWLIDTSFGKFELVGTGLSHEKISHLLGIARLDDDRAAEIWNDPTSVGGSLVRLDFSRNELTYVALEGRPEPRFVYPFTVFAGISSTPAPSLMTVPARRHHLDKIDLGEDFPLLPSELAGRMNLPLNE